ncbi:MAG: Flp pilus assembly complex ATPase component TadA [Candidatus Omnitrophica bacterium]|nr:Flp pilus assembly complex ATPase component TadA [Candidatus Omnitrophota bacterium]
MLNKQKILSEFLEAKGLANSLQLEQARQIQQRVQKSIDDILKDLGIIYDDNLSRLIIEELGITYIDGLNYSFEKKVIELINPFFAKRFRIIPLKIESEKLLVALDEPINFLSLDYFSETLGLIVEAELITKKNMDYLLKTYYQSEEDTTVSDNSSLGSEANYPEDDAPVIHLVSMLISDAYQKRASDIHIEPMYDSLRIRYRIDGILRQVESPDKNLQSSILSRIKLMAGLNIAEKRLPQDGRIRTIVNNKEFDLRISTLPAHYGESVVLRILDRRVIRIEEMGFSPAQIESFKNIVKMPNGIVLVTGPTGSGKSTTLYGVLNSINRSKKKILTVEDPVEYQINGINQVQVKTKIGLTFAMVLRSMLRQAPDIIMVGEIRDLETAKIAVQSALTGHLIFSTLHTNDAPSAVARIVDMGIKPYLVGATLQAVLAQRLIRLLCPDCKQAYKPPKDEIRILEIDPNSDTNIFKAKGCPLCANTGYLGRTGIFELLMIDEKIRRLAGDYVSSSVIREQARASGMTTLKEHARDKVLQGLTTFQELVRVTQSDVD